MDLENNLNPAQLEAVTTTEGPVLVIAGAGSGKTRTIVFRLAHLMENNVPPEAILLLTFTRKASQEMLNRATMLTHQPLGSVTGGTFHSFAHHVLRRTPPPGHTTGFTIMDRPDSESLLKDAKARLKIGQGDRSFPKIRTVVEYLSKSRNKEGNIQDILAAEAFHLAAYADDFQRLGKEYVKAKQEHNLLDYDDLLFSLESLLRQDPDLLARLRERYRYIMVDEYQDTNLVQARLVSLLAGEQGNIMAVGDDAQSIYAFRGANVHNILDFTRTFPGAKMVRLEQNYRSAQPILGLTNKILDASEIQIKKELFSTRELGPIPRLIRPLSDLTQAARVVDQVVDLLKKYNPTDIAVLFRAGFQSYHVEVGLNKLGIRFRKYGGLKYTEAAHIKDMLSFLRLVRNPVDLPAWQRALAHIKGLGPKTVLKVYNAIMAGDAKALAGFTKRWPALAQLLQHLDAWRARNFSVQELVEQILEFYLPILVEIYPDDYPRRQTGLEELSQIARSYNDLDVLLADLCLENPESEADDNEEAITLSTIHSAKGLEWSAVLIIDLVEERFPSRHALTRGEDFEEERRLLYVACTRAKDRLYLFSPMSLFRKGRNFTEPAVISPFIREICDSCYEEWREDFNGRLAKKKEAAPVGLKTKPFSGRTSGALSDDKTPHPKPDPSKLGYCTHKIFGRGKLVKELPPDKYRVHFPNFGMKVILTQYLTLEE